MKFLPIDMLYNNDISRSVKLSILWKYNANPSTKLALVKLYGVNNDGETLLGTATLTYDAANEYSSDVFGWVNDSTVDYREVILELDISNTDTTWSRIQKVRVHSHVTNMSEDYTEFT